MKTDHPMLLKQWSICGEDYSLRYEDNTAAGTGKVFITGIGNYGGTLTKSFTIGRANLSTASMTTVASVICNGKKQTPAVSVRLDGKEQAL